MILEHFAENAEEIELADYGMMLWTRVDHEFGQAAEGRPSDLDWLDPKERGWENNQVIGFLESHDEERLMYKVINYGLSEGEYNTREPEIALQRMASAATILFTLPGPRMIWQFGELGFDYSINWCTNGTVNGCRLDPKPIRWDYLEDENRKKLFDVYSNLLHLRNNYPTFSTDNYTFSDGNFFLKLVHLFHEEMDAISMVNYRVTNSDINPKFPYEGVWYEYFTGESLLVENTQEKLTHLPGEFRIYTSKRITPPNGFVTSTADLFVESKSVEIYPNPVLNGSIVNMKLESNDKIRQLVVYDMEGRRIITDFTQNIDEVEVNLPDKLSSGIYFIQAFSERSSINGKFVKQ